MIEQSHANRIPRDESTDDLKELWRKIEQVAQKARKPRNRDSEVVNQQVIAARAD